MRLARGCLTVALTLATCGFIACGSRTALPYDEELVGSTADSNPDVRLRPDGADASDPEDVRDDLPTIDVQPPRDVNRTDCPDADATLIYLVTTNNELLSFFPPTGAFRRIGVISCPASPRDATPFSMAVDRRGVAYVLFSSGQLFRVSTATAACLATSFRTNQQGFETFGMGYAANAGGPAETLFVASDQGGAGGGTGRLGSINTSTFNLTALGAFTPRITRAELTGTGGGDLFAFYSDEAAGGGGTDSFVGQIDKTNARVLAADRLRGVRQGQGWAFAFWGGDFYLFTAPDGPASRVTRFRPSDKSLAGVASYPTTIVGAGVSTCAPQ